MWTGLSRASLNELVLGSSAPVRSVVLRREGATRGIRLIHYSSLIDHLTSMLSSDHSIGESPDDDGPDDRSAGNSNTKAATIPDRS